MTMASRVIGFLAATPLLPGATIARQTSALDCSAPATGCRNGLWSASTCGCQCIPPFCPDSSGACLLPGGSCGGNPWSSCAVGEDCPWWKSLVSAEKCESGPIVPPGIWDVYGSEEACCDVNYVNSDICMPETATAPPTERPTPFFEETRDDTYELIPIKFSVSGLPEVVNMRELKAEMLTVLKRILSDLSGRVENLKVTNIEENLVLTVPDDAEAVMSLDADGSGAAEKRSEEVYYDITVLRDPDRKFGPVIIAGLRDSYDLIIQEIEDYANMEYFGFGVDLNWCIHDDEEGGGKEDGVFDMCARNEENVLLTFKLANVPEGIDLEGLILEFIEVYTSVLEGVDKLDVVGIEKKGTVDLQTDEEGDRSLDVVLDVVVVRKFDVVDFGPAINDRISTSKNDILGRIQSYSDDETDMDLNWCIHDDGAYAVCPQSEDSKYALPNWAIITLTVVSVCLACCICWCIMAWIRQRDEYRNERNMVSYIETGQNYHKAPKGGSGRRRPPAPPHRQRRERERRHRDDGYRRRHHHGSSRPRPQSQRPRQSRDSKPKKKKKRPRQHEEPRHMITNEPHYEEQEQPQRLMITNDTNYQYDNMPTFVFPNGNSNGGNGNNDGGLPPPLPQPLMLTNGMPDPGGEQFMIEDGTWFADEESVLPPGRR